MQTRLSLNSNLPAFLLLKQLRLKARSAEIKVCTFHPLSPLPWKSAFYFKFLWSQYPTIEAFHEFVSTLIDKIKVQRSRNIISRPLKMIEEKQKIINILVLIYSILGDSRSSDSKFWEFLEKCRWIHTVQSPVMSSLLNLYRESYRKQSCAVYSLLG